MGMSKPTGGYAEQMLEPGGWPAADEETFYDRARDFSQVRREVTDVLETCLQQRARVFDGGIWTGGAAKAADTELGAKIDQLSTLQHDLTTVMTWHDNVASSIVQAKSYIGDNVEAASRQIDVLQNNTALDADERTKAINMVLATTYGANVGVVTSTAEQILATKTMMPPRDFTPESPGRQPAFPDITRPNTPGPETPLPDAPGPDPSEPGASRPDVPHPDTPRPDTRPVDGHPADPTDPAPGPQTPAPGGDVPASPPAAAVLPPMQGTTPSPAAPPASTAPPPPGTTVGSTPGSQIGGPAAPASPAASTQPAGAGGHGKGLAPASASAPPVAAVTREDTSPPVSPAAATPAPTGGAPGGMMPPAAGRGGAGAGRSTGAGAPIAAKPLGAHPASKATSSSNRQQAKSGPAPHLDAPDRSATLDVPAVAAIPVSTARAERDAIAAASADARKGPDPLGLARRIAGALNAADSAGGADFGFFWVTAVTADGEIVVANSYGLAYIPEGIELPHEVHMATSDDAIPAGERATWATYPMLAVQGWAAHHQKTLRAVIATEAQFADSDPGAAKIILGSDDIPESGAMQGRSRLAVVDPDAGQRLSETTDRRLADLLPHAPATAESSVKAGPPADQRLTLWFEVMKPMASRAAGREAAHLTAFHTYAVHAQEIALAAARSALDPAVGRTAVADWLYWKHLSALLEAALAKA